MGLIIKTNPSLIRPSQNFLKEDTLIFIKKNFENGDLDKLPPTPIVRKDGKEKFIAIDGHNLLAFYSLRGLDCEVYVAESKDDALDGDSEMVLKRNKDLKEKYDNVLVRSDEIAKQGIASIKVLCEYTRVNL